MDIQAAGLIPVFIKDREPILKSKDMQDVTLDQWTCQLTGDTNLHWKWPHASVINVGQYLDYTLLSFCSDPKKIRATQEMIYALMHEIEFCNFILADYASFESWCDIDGRGGYSSSELVTSLDEFLLGLLERFNETQTEFQKIMAPFISKIKGLSESHRIETLREFNVLYKKPMEFRAYLSRHREYDDLDEDLRKHKNPSKETDREFVENHGIYWHETVCTVIDGQERIAIDEKLYMEGFKKRRFGALRHIPVWFIMKVFGIQSFEQFCNEFMPEAYEPLEIVLLIEPHSYKGYKVSMTLKEVDESIVLQHIDNKKMPPHLVPRQRTSEDKQKGQRNELQQKLIGREFKRFVKQTTKELKDYWHIEAVKVTYFTDFMSTYLDEAYELGQTLVEIRYLTFVADRLRLASYDNDIVFPEILPSESNTTRIIDAKNPVVVYDSKRKVPVVANSIIINDERRVQIITGPNQNGKSKYVDSLALNQIMFQAGWPIFAKEAQMSPKTDLRIHYVHSGVGISGESRFSHECQRMNKLFEGMRGAYPLILVDEPYTGTNYKHAELLIKEILQACSDENISIFLTTHFHGLIEFVSSLKNGWNLHCVIGNNGEFTYQIRDGSSTISNALVVAENAGTRFDQIKAIIQKKKSSS